MTDPADRPVPQYGEYATPEEQRARIRIPDASASLSAGEAPVAPSASTTRDRRPAPPAGAPRARSLTLDRFATVALLLAGFVNVVTGIASYLDYPAFAQRALDAAGAVAEFTNDEQGRFWGIVAAVALGLLWTTTALLAGLRMARGRLAFWVPLVGAVVAALVVGFCLAVPLVNDPAVLEALLRAP